MCKRIIIAFLLFPLPLRNYGQDSALKKWSFQYSLFYHQNLNNGNYYEINQKEYIERYSGTFTLNHSFEAHKKFGGKRNWSFGAVLLFLPMVKNEFQSTSIKDSIERLYRVTTYDNWALELSLSIAYKINLTKKIALQPELFFPIAGTGCSDATNIYSKNSDLRNGNVIFEDSYYPMTDRKSCDGGFGLSLQHRFRLSLHYELSKKWAMNCYYMPIHAYTKNPNLKVYAQGHFYGLGLRFTP